MNARVRYELLEETPGSKYRQKQGNKRTQRFRSKGRGDNPSYLKDQREVLKSTFSVDTETGHLKLTGSLDPMEDTFYLAINAFDAGEYTYNVIHKELGRVR